MAIVELTSFVKEAGEHTVIDLNSLCTPPTNDNASSHSEFAIQVQDLNLSFGTKSKVHVLNNLCMQVPRGSIYGLLGPSGCGKTSLIRSILGSLKYSSGSVKVFGEQPGSSHGLVPGVGVGYMPQDISLYPFLTISETLHYFGMLYNLSFEKRQEQIDLLTSFLKLPDTGRQVGDLSGGQKRRVSLASALIHKPLLLVLDEPTVGVDPLLRKSIWEYLVHLSQSGLTVLVTTHYIEEAKDAHQIGLMRNGRILEQDNPQSLLKRFQLSTLEQVFLRICTDEDARTKEQQEQESQEMEGQLELVAMQSTESIISRRQSTSSDSSGVASIHEHESTIDMMPVHALCANSNTPIESTPTSTSVWRQVGAMCCKNISKLCRSKASMLFQFALPTLEVVLFCLCIGLNVHSVPVSVFDEDRSELSYRFLQSLNPRTIRQEFYNTEQDAINAVRNGSASTALTIYSNFTTCLQDRLLMFGDVSDEVMRNSTIHLHPDMSNPLMVEAVLREVLRSFIQVGKQHLENLGISPNLLDMPVRVEEPVYGHPEPEFTLFMTPGVMLSIAFLAAVPLTTMNLVVERKDGMIERTVVAGVPHFLILLSHLLTQAIILAVQVFFLMLVVFPGFGIPFHGEFLEIMCLTMLQSMCGMSFGLLVSSVSDSENTATMLSLGIFYPMLLLSGTVWPIEAMNNYVRYFALCLPQTIPIASMRHMIARGWSIMHWDVAQGFLVSLAWIGAFLLVSTLIFRYRKI